MIHTDDISHFILELIKYADEEDIKLFLENCFSKDLKKDIKDDYRATMLQYLFEYIEVCTDKEIYTVASPQEKEIYNLDFKFLKSAYYKPKDLIHKNMRLYLHLYALCECYYSYGILLKEDKLVIGKIIELINKYFNKNIGIHSITTKDRTKILKMLINSYAKNKFYYYFHDNELIKLEIIGKNVNSKREYEYKSTSFELQDREGTTFIINEAKKINIPLKQKLHRVIGDKKLSEICSDEGFINGLLLIVGHLSFQDVKSIHEQIIKAIKKKPRAKYCKYCNPNPKYNTNETKCNNCNDLLFIFNSLKRKIDPYEPNEYILSVKDMDFEQIILDTKLTKNSNINKLRERRQNKLLKITKKLKKEINIEITDKSNNEYYESLATLVIKIEKCIAKSFENKIH